MKNFSANRLGGFCLAFLPFIICSIIINTASFFMIGTGASVSLLLFGSDSWYSAFSQVISQNDFNTMIMIVYTLMAICFYGLWYYSRCGGEYGKKAVRHFHVLRFAGIFLMVPGLQLMATIICNIIYFTIPSWMEAYEQLIEGSGADERAPLMLLYSIILAPVAEELVFRGVTLRLFRRVCPHFWTANLLQAILFGIFHQNWVQGFYAFSLGIVLGYVCEKGGTIYYSIFLHVLFNFWGNIITLIFDESQLSDFLLILLYAIYILLFAAGIFLFLLSFTESRRKKVPHAAGSFTGSDGTL